MTELVRRKAHQNNTRVGYMRPVADGRWYNVDPEIHLEVESGTDGTHVRQFVLTPAQAKRTARALNAAVKACS